MHKMLQVMLPNLQVIDMQINFAINIFSVVIKICKELGKLLRMIIVCMRLEDNWGHLKMLSSSGYLENL